MSDMKNVLEILVSYPVEEFDDVYVQFKETNTFNLLDYVYFSRDTNTNCITEDNIDDGSLDIIASYQLINSTDQDSNSASRKLVEEYRQLCLPSKN